MRGNTCPLNTPPWFVGHWRDWHRGHGCDRDDGAPRSQAGAVEIAQHEANLESGSLTDAELRVLRAATSSGNELRVRALDELAARRAGDRVPECARLGDDELRLARVAAASGDDLLAARAIEELARGRAAEAGRALEPIHPMKGPPGYRCTCGAAFDDYAPLAEHVRRTHKCPRCGSAADDLRRGQACRWTCGHWIARGDLSATLRDAASQVQLASEESP